MLIPLANSGTIETIISKQLHIRGNLAVMDCYMRVCEEFREKLGRQLQQNELEFLQWVYGQYLREKSGVSYEYSKL